MTEIHERDPIVLGVLRQITDYYCLPAAQFDNTTEKAVTHYLEAHFLLLCFGGSFWLICSFLCSVGVLYVFCLSFVKNF